MEGAFFVRRFARTRVIVVVRFARELALRAALTIATAATTATPTPTSAAIAARSTVLRRSICGRTRLFAGVGHRGRGSTGRSRCRLARDFLLTLTIAFALPLPLGFALRVAIAVRLTGVFSLGLRGFALAPVFAGSVLVTIAAAVGVATDVLVAMAAVAITIPVTIPVT